jgi:hypothetical protein
VTRKSLSPEDVFADLSDDVPRLSGETLAANVLAATVISCIGVDAAVADEARALLAQFKREGGDAHVVAVAEVRLEALLGELAARHRKH